MNLSKSRYTRGVQCPKMLWLETHRPELFDQYYQDIDDALAKVSS